VREWLGSFREGLEGGALRGCERDLGLVWELVRRIGGVLKGVWSF